MGLQFCPSELQLLLDLDMGDWKQLGARIDIGVLLPVGYEEPPGSGLGQSLVRTQPSGCLWLPRAPTE